MRQQLGLWAGQAAAVRAGNLQLTCKLGGLQDLGDAVLSPRADQAACHLDGREGSVVLLPVPGKQHDLRSELSNPAPGQTLTLPGAAPERIVDLTWSASGQHLVVVSLVSCPGGPLQVSTFRGAQLVGSFLEPLAEEDSPDSHVLLSDDAGSMLLTVFAYPGSRVVACTPQGVVTARHPAARISRSTASVDGGHILRASELGDRLYIHSASEVQEIDLQRPPAAYYDVQVSCWGGAATVHLISGQEDRRADELLFVDLAQQKVQHSVRPGVKATVKDCRVVQGARSVALVEKELVIFLAASGRDAGNELFRCLVCQGHGQWDSLGRFFAVVQELDGNLCVSVLDGLTGAPVAAAAVQPACPFLDTLRWLPGSSGLVVDEEPFVEHHERRAGCSWTILRFASAGPEPPDT